MKTTQVQTWFQEQLNLAPEVTKLFFLLMGCSTCMSMKKNSGHNFKMPTIRTRTNDIVCSSMPENCPFCLYFAKYEDDEFYTNVN